MTSKKVWAIVFIILGVIAVLTGINAFLEVNALDKLMNSWPLNETSGVKSLDSILYHQQQEYVEAARYSRIMAIVRIVAGVALSLWGTTLLREEERRPVVADRPIVHPEDENRYDDWKM